LIDRTDRSHHIHESGGQFFFSITDASASFHVICNFIFFHMYIVLVHLFSNEEIKRYSNEEIKRYSNEEIKRYSNEEIKRYSNKEIKKYV